MEPPKKLPPFNWLIEAPYIQRNRLKAVPCISGIFTHSVSGLYVFKTEQTVIAEFSRASRAQRSTMGKKML